MIHIDTSGLLSMTSHRHMKGNKTVYHSLYQNGPIFIVSLAIFLLSFAYYLNTYQISDTVQFGGDSWEYQTYAVNLIHGHGYKIGGEEPLETYKFSPLDTLPQSLLNRFFDNGGRYSFYRTPSYPFFLVGIYSLFGINPKYAYIAQMMLLAFVASTFPAISYFYWRKKGLLSGIASAILFVLFFSPDPTQIMTEPLLVFTLAVWTLAFLYWQCKERSKWRTFLLGVFSGVMILTKGLTIFIPFLFLLYLVYKVRPLGRRVYLTGVFLLGLGCLLLPWGGYVYQKRGHFVMLSGQGRYLLIDSNNQHSLNDGAWHPEWRKQHAGDQRYLANQQKYQSSSAFLITLRFWQQYKSKLPRFFYLKLQRAFGGTLYQSILLFMMSFYLLALFSGGEKTPLFPLMYFVNILLITLLFYGNKRFVIVFMGFFLIPAMYFPIVLIRSCLLLRRRLNNSRVRERI